MIKIGLAGFGKTGRAVATVLLRTPGFSLEWVLRKSDRLEHRSVAEFLGEDVPTGDFHSIAHQTAAELLDRQPVDVIVDFSAQEGIDYYGEAAASRGVTIVSAVSHYDATHQSLLANLAGRTRVFWSPNITIGVNYLMITSKILQRMIPGLDFQIVEEHFRDKPGISGTASRMATELGLDDGSIKTVRAGGIIGRHEIICGFPFQTVRLVHESISREAFGNGVVFVINNLMDKPQGLYDFGMLMKPYFTQLD